MWHNLVTALSVLNDQGLLDSSVAKRLRRLFEEFTKAPFPQLGRVVGDFGLYDSLLSGTVSAFLDGAKVDVSRIPSPDGATTELCESLKGKTGLDVHEAEFLEYVRLLDELRGALDEALRAGDGADR